MQQEIMKTDPNEETTTATSCVQTDAGAVVASVDYQEGTVDDVLVCDKDEDEGNTDDDGQVWMPVFLPDGKTESEVAAMVQREEMTQKLEVAKVLQGLGSSGHAVKSEEVAATISEEDRKLEKRRLSSQKGMKKYRDKQKTELAEKMATGNPEVLAEIEAQKKVRNANRRQKHAKKRKTVDLSQTAIVPLITSVPYKKQRAMTTRFKVEKG